MLNRYREFMNKPMTGPEFFDSVVGACMVLMAIIIMLLSAYGSVQIIKHIAVQAIKEDRQ